MRNKVTYPVKNFLNKLSKVRDFPQNTFAL